ncbi:MAG: NAD-dependent epimerase/dehydratase family protein [Desulfopila sp.]
MLVLVTGAAGFIGSYLIPALTGQGNRVYATDLVAEPAWLEKMPQVTYFRGDLSREEDVYKMMGLAKPDKVVHLVSLLAGPCEADPRLGYRVNFNSTLALLDACVTYGVKRFVMTSSISVFGKGLAEPVPDDAPKQPATVYGQTKLACEHLMEWYRRVHGLGCAAVRFPWVFGPGRTTGITAEYSSKLLDMIGRGEKLIIDNPEEKGDWLYVKDAVKSLLLLLEIEDQPQIAYNIMGEVYTVREAMEIARKIFPEAEIELVDRHGTLSPYPAAYDDSRARAEIGWEPDYSLATAMTEHVEFVRNNNRGCKQCKQ